MENNDGNVPDPPEFARSGRILLDTLAEAVLGTTIFVFRFFAWAFRWSVATVVMLLVMAAAGIFVFNQAVVGGEPVRVPNIQGMSLSEAESLLIENGLVLGTPSLVESEEVPANYILSQRPKAGDVVRAGRRVHPSVSRGVRTFEAPEIVGKSLNDAADIIESSGLRIAQPAYMPHSAARDTVIAQDPPAGRTTSDGQIRLLVSSGSGTGMIMPQLTGLPLQEVAARLSRLGVTGRPLQVNRPDAPFDVVLEQRPAAGATITPGMVVEYEIRASEVEQHTDLLREVQIVVPLPGGTGMRRVWAEGIWKDGTREVLFNEREAPAGGQISFPFYFSEEATAVIYVDGVRYRSYYCEGDSPPVVDTHPAWRE